MPGKSAKTLFIILLILAVAFFFGKSISSNSSKQKSTTESETAQQKNQPTKLIINNYTFNIEVADDEKEQGRGLSSRDNLASDAGMLFVYDRLAFYTLWMKDMKFPLDFIWIKGDKIDDISENIPAPTTEKLEELPTYTSKSAVDKVLEVNAGKAKEIKANIGDKITLITE